jgi:hypothetical protein
MLSDKAPYIVTIVMAGLAWTLTHIVDRLLTTPLLSYQIQQLQGDGKKSFYLTLKNITRDKTFHNLRIIITAAADSLLTEPAIIPVQPASEGDQPFSLEDRTLDFTFPEIQPGWQFEISAGFQGEKIPTLRMSLMGDQTLYAVTPSLETFLVEHDIGLLFALVVLWIAALVIILSIQYFSSAPNGATRYDS